MGAADAECLSTALLLLDKIISLSAWHENESLSGKNCITKLACLKQSLSSQAKQNFGNSLTATTDENKWNWMTHLALSKLMANTVLK